MDKVGANHLFKKINGQKWGLFTICEYVNHGKSALVVKAVDSNGIAVAIKVFDPDLVEHHGRAAQLERINRERTLIGVEHPHLIRILDGGEWDFDGISYLYVTMEFFAGWNLAEVIASIPRTHIPTILKQLSSAAHFLDERQICHRDIKPQNIGILESLDSIKLLDLGVIRPFYPTPVTDGGHGHAFVGTTRYASPEYALCKEEASSEGWRAITFYQIGAVVHDLIMKRRIFSQYTDGSTALHLAVVEETPEVAADDVPQWLCRLAKSCLVKTPATRLALVSWSELLEPSAPVNLDCEIEALQKQIQVNKESILRKPRQNEIEQRRLVRTHHWEEFAAALRKWYSSGDRFPPAAIDCEHMEEGSSLRLQINPGHKFGLTYFVGIYLAVHWSSTGEGVCTIDGSAVASRAPAESIGKETETIYHSVWDDKSVLEASERYLVAILSEVYALPIDPEVDQPPNIQLRTRR